MSMPEYRTPFSTAIEENDRLHRRIQAAEKLLNGRTVRDLCGENTWAFDACEELLDEFWEIDDDSGTA